MDAEREIKKRVSSNPLRYYWPHTHTCKGKHPIPPQEDFNKRGFKLPDGTEYEISGCPQYSFHSSLALTRAIFGGNRSGKTCAGAVEVGFHSTGQYPDWYPLERRYNRPVKGRLFAQDYGKGVNEVIIPAIREWFPDNCIHHSIKNNQGVETKFWIKHKTGGLSVFDILTYEMDSKQAEGWHGDFVWYDEPPPRTHRVATLRGLTDRMGWEIFTLTPLDQPWLFDEIWDSTNTNIEVFLMDIRHNLIRKNPTTGKFIGLTEEAIERFESGLTDEEKQVRRHGKFTHLAGRIWKGWQRNVHTFDRNAVWNKEDDPSVVQDGEPPRHWPRAMLIDPHDRKPAAVIWVAKDPKLGRYWVYREAWLKDMMFADMVAYIRDVEMMNRETMMFRVMDPNFGPKRQGNTGITVRDTFEQEARTLGYPMRFMFGDDHKQLGRKAVDRMLHYDKTKPISIINQPQIMISDDLVNCIYMIEHYIWDDYKLGTADKDPKEQPKDLNTDFPDLLHYLALLNWKESPAEVFHGVANPYAEQEV